MEIVIDWLLSQGWAGLVIGGLAWAYYNERKERMEITRLYMQLQLELLEILSDARHEAKENSN